MRNTCTQVSEANENAANIFFVVRVADDGRKWLNPATNAEEKIGTAYVAYSNGFKTFLRHSLDGGRTWSNRVRVSDGLNTRTSLFPWMETGPTPGSVGIVWYGTSNAVNNDDANWQVFYAQSFNADEEVPTFRQVTASDHFIHASNISTGGTLGTANRNLIDYFQVSFDPTGAAVISYTDDHNDFDGHTYVTGQISGASINNEGTTNIPAPVEGSGLPPRTVPAADAPQVTDFAQDVQVGLLAVVPLNDPLDILSVKYSCETTLNGPVIVAKMKVSDLTLVPPGAAWRSSGKILGKTVSFEISADDLPSGRLKYHDKEQNIDFASDRITSFTRLASNKVTFSGEATINGQKVMFTVEVEDNGNARGHAHAREHSIPQVR